MGHMRRKYTKGVSEVKLQLVVSDAVDEGCCGKRAPRNNLPAYVPIDCKGQAPGSPGSNKNVSAMKF